MIKTGGQDWRKRIPRRVNFVEILPNELLVYILRDCSAKDIGRISRVCKNLHDFIQDHFKIWEMLVRKGEHKEYFTTEPASPSINHIVESFRSSLLLPVNLQARLGRGKGFPYSTMFLHPQNIQGMALNSRSWIVLKNINAKNSMKCKVLVEKINTTTGGRIQEFYMDVKKKIPRREHERGLEIGGIFFEADSTKVVATEFNELFK